MSADWQTVKLEDIAEVERGKFSVRPRNDPRYYGGDIPFLQTGDVTGASGIISSYSQTLNKEGLGVSKFFPAGTLLITIAANIGDVAEVMFGFACTDSLVAVQPKKGINKNWLKYFLQTQKRYFKSRATQNAQANINLQIIKPLPVLLPPQKEQVAIADVLSTWEQAIEKTERLIVAKEKQLCILYQKYFQPGTLMNGSWKSAKLSEYLKSRNEKSLPSEEMPLYSLTIEDGVTAKTDRYNRDFLVKDTNSKTYKVVYPDDIVFNPSNLRWGAIARSEIDHKVVISPIYEVLEIRKKVVDPELLNHALTCPRQIGIFASKTEGTLIERMAVKLDTFLLTEILLPETIDEQRKIAILLDSAKKEILLLKKQANAYRQQKRGLMQKLLTGQWRVNISEEVEQ